MSIPTGSARACKTIPVARVELNSGDQVRQAAPALTGIEATVVTKITVRNLCGGKQALARLKYWQITTDFTTLLLYKYHLNSGYKDYSQNLLVSLTYLGFL
jgi:hypothetical protein